MNYSRGRTPQSNNNKNRGNQKPVVIDYPKVKLHPHGLKYLKQGHPWIIKDKFTQKFPTGSDFLLAMDDKNKPVAILLNDPKHPRIKARVWEKNLQKITPVYDELDKRIAAAMRNRLPYFDERSHICLAFGEADNLPGLKIYWYNTIVLVQIESGTWLKKLHLVHDSVEESLGALLPNLKINQIIFQKRFSPSKVEVFDIEQKPITIEKNVDEQEFNLKIKLGEFYDCGVYTDMAGPRNELNSVIPDNKDQFLNLFSYTGAFSLWAMKNDFKRVTSLDLSENYMKWLEENISLNRDMKLENHESMVISIDDGMAKLSEQNKKFDMIVCDPPTSFTDGENKTRATDMYKKHLPELIDMLTLNGVGVFFINSHSVKMERFQTLFSELPETTKAQFTIIKKIGLSEDFPINKNFPEGNYLKGIIVQKCVV